MPQPTPIAVMNSVMLVKWADPVSLDVRPQSTTPWRLHARMLISAKIASVTGTVYFSNVRIR